MSINSWIGLLEGFPSAGQGPIQGELIPSLDRIESRLEKTLVLSNKQYPREGAVRLAAELVRDTALKYGKETAAAVLDEIFRGSLVLHIHKGESVNGQSKDGSNRAPYSDDCDCAKHLSESAGDGASSGQSSYGAGGDSGCAQGAQVFALPTRKQRDGISRRLVELELTEHELDLSAFQTAYSAIHRRVTEVKDEGRLMALVNWSGTSAVMGSLELAIHAMERTIEELRDILKRMDAGAIVNSDED